MDVDDFDLLTCFPSSSGPPSTFARGAKRSLEADDHDLLTSDRAVEVGLVGEVQPVAFVIFAEHYPIWIPALEPGWITDLVIHGFRCLDEFRAWFASNGWPFDLIERSLARYTMKRVKFLVSDSFPTSFESVTTCDRLVFLLSGSLPYLQRLFLLLSGFKRPIIGTFDHHYAARLRPATNAPSGIDTTSTSFVQWHRLRHPTIGGSSTYISLHAVCHVATNYRPITSAIRRTLKHVIQHSVRPNCISGSAATSISVRRFHLTISDRLRPDYLHQQVIYPTHFCASGWGMRSLAPSELADIYGFPVRLKLHIDQQPEVFPLLVPFGLLHSMVLPILRTPTTMCECVVPFMAGVPKRIRVSPVSSIVGSDDAGTWLPHIKRWLPHIWIDTSLVTNKAVKADNAGVPVTLWDNRLLLLYPHWSVRHLDLLRSFLLRRCRYNLFRSFCDYLRQCYTNHWVYLLYVARGQFENRLQGGEQGSITPPFHTPLSLSFLDVISNLHVVAERGIDVLMRWDRSTWWEWSDGSALVFWRWGQHTMLALDGVAPYISSALPTWRPKARQASRRRRLSAQQTVKYELVATKLKTILDKRYITPGPITSFTQFFDVPKGTDDIRLVYNGTSCGLNGSLWSPNFWLPTAKTALRLMDFNYYSVDLDIGEMFLNFPLHESLQAVSGIDLTPYRQVLNLPINAPAHYRWVRTWMGARPSPYVAVLYYYLADELIRGNHQDTNNPFYWDQVQLNLPGSSNFDPTKPRVMKIDTRFHRIAADLVTYIDDLRGIAATCELAWLISRRIAAILQYLGIQDASRKRRPPTRTPGAWAGAVIRTSADNIIVTVTEEKWLKARALIDNLIAQLQSDLHDSVSIFDVLNYKELEIARGFLVHLSMTYDVLVHHIKGFHLTLASYLPQRDSEGWKFTDQEWKQYLFHRVAAGDIDQSEMEVLLAQPQPNAKPPVTIKIVRQLKNDLLALQTFFAIDKPPDIHVRRKNVCMILYGFADASGGGFGSTVLIPGSGIRYRVGVWGVDDDNTSSNFKEFENVVLTIEEEAQQGTLQGSLMFLFTDNATVEAALHKGNSSSRRLFELIVRLRKVQLEQGATITVSHISGKRMIAQGTDGISRGMLNEGDGNYKNMLSFIPLHLNAFERSPVLSSWVQSWLGDDCEILSPQEWFTKGHQHIGGTYNQYGFWHPITKPGKFVWVPPPAAAEVALEELRKSLIKRRDSTHVVLIPRLLLPEWRRSLGKAADLVFQINVGTTFWPDQMFEPLTIGVVFPFLSSKPWQCKHTPKMFYMARRLSKVFEESEMVGRDLLRQLLHQIWSLRSMSERMVRRVLYYESHNRIPCESA